ncbi:hypothetical protein AKJ16_DCAP11832 [Drosera capensis]
MVHPSSLGMYAPKAQIIQYLYTSSTLHQKLSIVSVYSGARLLKPLLVQRLSLFFDAFLAKLLHFQGISE